VQSGETWMGLHALHRHGWTVSALAREFGLSRNTVRRELAGTQPRHYAKREARTGLNEVQLAHVARVPLCGTRPAAPQRRAATSGCANTWRTCR